jgi:predicted HD phosphohydrolase
MDVDGAAKTEPSWGQALDRVVDYLSAAAHDRFLRFGPDDERGAALWDASIWVDEQLTRQIYDETSSTG